VPSRYSFAFSVILPACPDPLCRGRFICTHSCNTPTSPSMTCTSIPALRHIRTRSSPAGTVGGTTGRTIKPRSRNSFDRACGSGVIRPRIGEAGSESKFFSPVGNGRPNVFGRRRTLGEVDARSGVKRSWRWLAIWNRLSRRVCPSVDSRVSHMLSRARSVE